MVQPYRAVESIERFIEDQALAVVRFGSSPTPSPVSKLSLFLSLPARRQSSLLAEEEGEGGAKSYDGEKAWSSIIHLRLLVRVIIIATIMNNILKTI